MRPSRLVPLLVFAAIASACDSASPTRGHLGGGASQFGQGEEGYGRDWSGVFRGAGRGVIGSMNVDARDVTLTIQLDPDSVRVDGCGQCVTIALDTLFRRSNVFLADPQSVVVRYTDEGTRYVLGLDLFSGSGGTANVVQAGLRIEGTGGGPVLADMTYVLER